MRIGIQKFLLIVSKLLILVGMLISFSYGKDDEDLCDDFEEGF